MVVGSINYPVPVPTENVGTTSSYRFPFGPYHLLVNLPTSFTNLPSCLWEQCQSKPGSFLAVLCNAHKTSRQGRVRLKAAICVQRASSSRPASFRLPLSVASLVRPSSSCRAAKLVWGYKWPPPMHGSKGSNVRSLSGHPSKVPAAGEPSSIKRRYAKFYRGILPRDFMAYPPGTQGIVNQKMNRGGFGEELCATAGSFSPSILSPLALMAALVSLCQNW